MADIAQIGFRAETDELKEAKDDLNALVPAAQKAERAAETFSGKMGRVADTLSGKVTAGFTAAKGAMMGFAAGMLAAFSAGAILSALSNISQSIDDISKAASKLKVNMGDLQGLGLAADLSGVAFSELATAAQRMNKVLGQAIATGKGTEGVFKILGISAQELSAMPIDERFGAIADRMNAMNLTADQTALILSKLGDRNGSLAALFEGGSEAINEASNMLDRFNGKLTNEQGKQVEAMNDAFTALGYALQSAGTQLVAFIAPLVGGAIQAFAEGIGVVVTSLSGMSSILSELAKGIAIALGPVAIAYVAQLTLSILSGLIPAVVAATTAVYGLATALYAAALANPFTAVLVAIGLVLASIYWFRDQIKRIFGIDVVAITKSAANAIINSFSGAFQAVGIIWDALPSLLGSAAVGAVNFVIKELNRLVQTSLSAINAIVSAIPEWMGGPSGDMIDVRKWQAPILKDPWANDTAAAFDSAASAFKAQMQIDNFSSAVERTKDDAVNTTPAINNFSSALDNTAKSAGAATEKLTELQKIGAELDKLSAPFDQAKSAYDKLQELQKNGIVTGDQYTSMLERIRAAFIATGGTADQWGKIIASKTNDMTTALKDFSTNALTSVGDTLADLAVDGKADFKALADGIIKDLIRMMWQALVVKPIIGSIFGFGDGGMFTPAGVTAFANGGAFTNRVVNQPTLFQFASGAGFGLGVMGEAGAEAVMPLKRGRDGSLGIQAHGAGGGSSHVNQLVFGDVNVNMPQSSGNEAQDRAQAAAYADAFEQRIRDIASDQFGRITAYGGSSNPRGIGR